MLRSFLLFKFASCFWHYLYSVKVLVQCHFVMVYYNTMTHYIVYNTAMAMECSMTDSWSDFPSDMRISSIFAQSWYSTIAIGRQSPYSLTESAYNSLAGEKTPSHCHYLCLTCSQCIRTTIVSMEQPCNAWMSGSGPNFVWLQQARVKYFDLDTGESGSKYRRRTRPLCNSGKSPLDASAFGCVCWCDLILVRALNLSNYLEMGNQMDKVGYV